MSLTYKLLIDPLTSRLRKQIIQKIDPGSSVLDIACGPGTLLVDLSSKIKEGTGIDLDSKKISFAARYAEKKGLSNLNYEVVDAEKLAEVYQDKFDYVVLSLAIHQFSDDVRYKIMEQAIKVSKQLILADYTVPVPCNFSGLFSKTIERIAGEDHYAAYRSYVTQDGLTGIVNRFGLKQISLSTIGSGVFSIGKFEVTN